MLPLELSNEVRWLARANDLPSQEILEHRDAPSRRSRAFGAAAAARVATSDQGALRYAATSSDPDVSGFAVDELKSLALRTLTIRERLAYLVDPDAGN
jgi:hypothetical protein